MQIAFVGGDVHAEVIANIFYFKVRDLIALTDVPRQCPNVYGRIKANDTIPYYIVNTGEKGWGTTKYVEASYVTRLLDAIHKRTRPKTIFVMREFLEQFHNVYDNS